MSSMNKNFLENFDPNCIQDLESARRAIVILLNLVESLAAEKRALREENQSLHDEIHRLKGVTRKPLVNANRPTQDKPAPPNFSSEKERQVPQAWRKSPKLAAIKIDREEVCKIDPSQLPGDAIFKGYEPVVVQDLKITTDNSRFWKAKYYSPSENKSYLADLPSGYACPAAGQGWRIRAWN